MTVFRKRVRPKQPVLGQYTPPERGFLAPEAADHGPPDYLGVGRSDRDGGRRGNEAERCSSELRVSAVLYVMKVPLEGKTLNFCRISRPDDVAELHGPL